MIGMLSYWGYCTGLMAPLKRKSVEPTAHLTLPQQDRLPDLILRQIIEKTVFDLAAHACWLT